MIYPIGEYNLRCIELKDLPALYQYKNDPEIAALLGGFSFGYSMKDLQDWFEFHRQRKDEVVWSIVKGNNDVCLGHVALYKIDYRVRMAEFAILIGDKSAWGKGVGMACTKFVLEYGFRELNLNRIYLEVLSTNERAIKLYSSIGFKEEGRLRQSQYKGDHYIDVLIMGILRDEHTSEIID